MKVLNSSHLSPFGGLNFVHQEFDRLKVGALLKQELPVLAAQSHYDWRDLLYSFWSIYFCGGDCIEDLSRNLRNGLKQTPHLKTPSPDSILKRMKELACSSEFFDTPKGTKKHQFYINEAVNSLNIKLIKDRIKKREQIVLDYDNTLLYSKKADAKMTYKKQFGYAPGVGIIGDNVVYVENRNGNSDAQTLQQDTLERMFKLLENEDIIPDIFRADGASYQLSTISMIDKHVDKLFVRARMSQTLFKAIQNVEIWEEVVFDGRTILRGSTVFTPFESIAKRKKKEHLLKPYRLIISKEKRDDGQINLFTGEAFNYHAL